MASRQRGFGRKTTELCLTTGGSSYSVRGKWNFPGNTYSEERVPIPISRVAAFSNRHDIADVVGKPYKYNTCIHIKHEPHILGSSLPSKKITMPARGTVPYNTWYTVEVCLGELQPMEYSIDSHLQNGLWPNPSLPGMDWSALVEKVGDRLDGSMKASSNMLVNLAQLGQTVGMIKNPFQLLKPDVYRKVKHLSAKNALSAVGSAWLEYRYGWENLRRDMKALASSLSRVRAHQKYLAEHSGSWLPFHERKTDSVTNPSFSVTEAGTPTNSVGILPQFKEYRRTCAFSAEYLPSSVSRKYSTWDFLQQDMGVNDLADALWDVVPFSFVVDWFIDVGDILNRNPIYWNSHRLRRVGYSTKCEWVFDIRIRSNAVFGANSSGISSVQAGPKVVRSTYERVEGFPLATSGVGVFQGLNLVHLADSAAIIAQRL